MNTLLNNDCLLELPKLQSESIDLILTDLPYGVTNRNEWDSIIPLDKLWSEYERIIKPNGIIALTAIQPFTSLVVSSNIKLFKYEWIWEKDSGTGFLNCHKQPLRNHESILIFYKSPGTYNPQMREGFKPYREVKTGDDSSNYGAQPNRAGIITSQPEGKRYPVSILRFKRDVGLHPTQKPLELMRYLIKTYTNKGDLVLDSTMGSGTTCVAAKIEERKYIGIEKDKEIFETAKKRIEEVSILEGLEYEVD